MKKQLIVAIVGLGLIIAVGLLWMQVQELERTVAALKQRPASNGITVSLPHPEPANSTEKKHVFKLIDTAPTTMPARTEIGVPWDVERAMMGSGKENARPFRKK